MNQDELSEQIGKLVPKSLDDIIRKNRDKLKCQVAVDDDLLKVAGEITEPEVTAELGQVYFYKRVSLVPTLKKEVLTMVGYTLDGLSYHTSEIKRFDSKRMRVVTNSGSIYTFREIGSGEPPEDLLMMICAQFHKDGAGSYLGVPEFFIH